MRKRTKGVAKKYESEADLCSAFISGLDPSWTAYPEANGFDIFLVHESGYQIGVEAKRSASVRLLAQLAEQTRRYRYSSKTSSVGPDVVAALVPQTEHAHEWGSRAAVSTDFATVARSLGASILFPGPMLFPGKPRENNTRMKVPEVIGDDIAGSPSGASCTPWKIGAIKVCLEMREAGFVTTETFKKAEIKPSLWTRRGWLKNVGRTGRITRYEKDVFYIDYAERHPEVVKQLAEKRSE